MGGAAGGTIQKGRTVTKTAEQNGHIVLSLDQIMAADDLQTEWVSIPEWSPRDAPNPDAYGVYVRSLNGRERADWQQSSLMGNGKNATVNFQQYTVKLVALAAVDAAGKRVFIGLKGSELLTKNSAILERIGEVAMRLSGIGEEEMEAISGNSKASEEALIS